MALFKSLFQSLRSKRQSEDAWRGFNRVFAIVLAGATALVFTLLFLVDPLGVVPFSLPIDRPVVDIKQRHFYPMVIRSRRFDSLVIGTSTGRLLDPDRLDKALGGRFANLSLNDGRAWEQWRLADLYLREIGPPKSLLIALDGPWCHPEADAPENLITKRGFPEWIYDENPWNDILHLVNGRMLEFSIRTIVTKLGLRPKRLADSGFAVFVPPEEEYDLARARTHIWGTAAPALPPASPPLVLAEAERARLKFPALAWIEDLQARTKGKTRFIYLWTPVHVKSQPAPGSRAAALEEECKSRLDTLARDTGAFVIDWRIPSPLTRNDENYWDALHYRLPIAHAMINSLVAAKSGQASDPEGAWIVRHAP